MRASAHAWQVLQANTETLSEARMTLRQAQAGLGSRFFVNVDEHGVRIRKVTVREITAMAYGVNSFFEPGQAVLVRYRVEKGRNIATDITRVGSAGGEGSISNPAKISAGKVKLVNASQLVIEDGGRELNFGITGDTNVLAKGASKATKAAGGSTPITTFVHTGDTVSVSYHEAGAKMTASEVRVTVVNK